jgi:predicted transcriptional regulator
MAPSKLEKYLNVLEVLVDRPKKLDDIAYMANIECNAVKRSLEFLILNGLIEERSLRNGKRVVYAITERGLSVFKTLRMLKYLEKLKDTLPIVEEAREITPTLNQNSNEDWEDWEEE